MKKFVGNPDSASRRLHYIPNSDNRCKLRKIKNPQYFESILEVERKTYLKKNDCFWCIKNKPVPFNR